MPDLLTQGPDEIIGVTRYAQTHTPLGEKCEGGPFEKLVITTYGANNLVFDIRKNARSRDGVPTCVAGLRQLRNALNEIIAEYSGAEPNPAGVALKSDVSIKSFGSVVCDLRKLMLEVSTKLLAAGNYADAAMLADTAGRLQ